MSKVAGATVPTMPAGASTAAAHDCGPASTLVNVRTVDPWPVKREKATDGRLRSAGASGTTPVSTTASGACPFR